MRRLLIATLLVGTSALAVRSPIVRTAAFTTPLTAPGRAQLSDTVFGPDVHIPGPR